MDAGHIGIRVKLAGAARGVQNAPIVTGWVVFNPLTEQIIEFPTSVQNITWTKDVNEGNPIDESLFKIDTPTPPDKQIRFIRMDEVEHRKLAVAVPLGWQQKL